MKSFSPLWGKIEKTKIERVEITGPMGHRKAITEWLYENDYRIRTNGPKITNGTSADMRTVHILAEKYVTR